MYLREVDTSWLLVRHVLPRTGIVDKFWESNWFLKRRVCARREVRSRFDQLLKDSGRLLKFGVSVTSPTKRPWLFMGPVSVLPHSATIRLELNISTVLY